MLGDRLEEKTVLGALEDCPFKQLFFKTGSDIIFQYENG
jgi:hypothetical protein